MNMNKYFWRLFFSQAITNIGDVLYIMTLITVLYDLYDSVFILSLLPFIITICKFSCGLFSPLILDKFDLKKLLLFSQLLKTILFLLLIVVLQLPTINLLLLLIIVACISVADGIQQPITFALIPSLVDEQYLLKANSATSVSFQTSDLLTWSIGAVIVTYIGSVYSLSITLVLYICSFILVLLIKVNEATVQEEFDELKQSIKASLTEGWQFILKDTLLRKFLMMDIVKGVAYTIWVAAVLYVFVEEVLHVGQEWWGYMNTARIMGALIAGFIVYKLTDRLNNHLYRNLFLASCIIAVLSFSFGINTIPVLALILVFLLGFPEQLDEIVQATVIQIKVKEKQLAKVYTAQSMVYYFVFSVAVLVVGALVDLLNVRIIFIAASLLLFINTIITWHIKRNVYLYEQSSSR